MARLRRILGAYVTAAALVGAFAGSAHAQPACVQARVERLAPLPTSADLADAAIVVTDPGFVPTDDDPLAPHTLVIAGRDGALLVSADAGQSFRAAEVPDTVVGVDWRVLQAPAAGIIIAATDDGRRLARSDDAGLSWHDLELPRGLAGPIAWLGPDTAIVAPDGQLAARTLDAGASWETFTVDPPLSLAEDAAVLDVSTAFAVGRSGLAGTTDGGRSWTPIALTDDPTADWLHAIAFLPDRKTGYVAGNGVLFRTRDAGRTWQPISIDERAALAALALPDADTVYVLTRNGALWRSFDAGATFDVVELPEGDLASLAFVDRDHGYVVGAYGTLLATDDAGLTWRSLKRGGDRTLHAVVPLADDQLLAVGAGGTVLAGTNLEPPANVTLPALPALYDVAWDGRAMVAVGQDALVAADTDALDAARTVDADGDVSGRVAARASGEFYAVLEGRLVRVDASGRQSSVSLDAAYGAPTRLDARDGTLFVATSTGILTSSDGGSFRRLGPAGLRVTSITALATDRALVRLEGGALAELDGDTARLIGLEPELPVLTAHLTESGIGWAGAAFGLLMRIEPDTGHTELRVLPGAGDEAVVAVAFRDATHGAALTSAGRVFLSDDAGESWSEHAGPWPGTPVASNDVPGLTGRGAGRGQVGAIVWLGETTLIAAGAGGHARRLELGARKTAVIELETPILADLETALRVDSRVYLAGGGRTVLVSDDAGASWSFLSDDLAPERIVGLHFDPEGVGTLATATGGLLAFGLELAAPPEDDVEPRVPMGSLPGFANLGREPGPLVALRDTDDGRLWLINGDAELLVSADRGENWEVFPAVSWQQRSVSVADFDVRDDRLLLVGNGRVQIGRLDGDDDPLGPAMLPSLSGLHAPPGGGTAIAPAADGSAAITVAADASLQCLSAELPSGVRDAAPHDGGWLLVGDGGLVSVLRPSP